MTEKLLINRPYLLERYHLHTKNIYSSISE